MNYRIHQESRRFTYCLATVPLVNRNNLKYRLKDISDCSGGKHFKLIRRARTTSLSCLMINM